MNKIITWIIGGIATIALVISSVALVSDNQSTPSTVGGSTADNWSVGGNLSVAGTSAFTGDATVSGGTLNVTTSNTATSTAIIGCVQTYATSTATPWRSIASSTATIEGVDGVMLLQYGSCPNL